MQDQPSQAPYIDDITATLRFSISVGGCPVRCMASREIMQTRYGATEDTDSWLRAFIAHSTEIEAEAVLRYQRDLMVPVILHTEKVWKRGF